ncbi:lytic transglycosylase domain-containing protein [Anaerovorax odorimutans]|uniref:lytic transglycosylase domain-containing protein n=1 Tax=Anaerovorax odorimutans TaxID=109327 RepID=UPI000416EE58|nr:transglycosylase SLT domain-containing protein [Anaerovorax odorimutans]
MAKKLLSVWLSLTILLFSSISIYAEENVQGDFFIKNININGEKIINYELQYSFITYNSAVYLPLTEDMGKICGFEAQMDWESRTLKLLKTNPTQKNISERWLKNDNKDIQTQVANDIKVLAYEEPELEDDIMAELELSVEELDLGGLPILTKGKRIFLPVRALTKSKIFNWDSYFDSYYGLCISTKDGVAASTYWNQAESNYNKGLVKYIKSYNKNHSTEYAQELVFLFQRAADVYNIDEKVLMAVAQKESTFSPTAQSKHGALGLMQIMPSTGASYGLSKWQLLDAKTNIDFGAMYLSNSIANYNGNVPLALSAYNQGAATVNRGSYSRAYANRVLGAKGNLENFLQSSGYGTGN